MGQVARERAPNGLTEKGKVRKPPPGGGLWPHEIEPGRAVVNNWDTALFETWEERKARRAVEKAAAQ